MFYYIVGSFSGTFHHELPSLTSKHIRYYLLLHYDIIQASSFCSSFHVIEVQSKLFNKKLTVDNWHGVFRLNTVLFRFLVLVFWHTLILQDIKIFTNFYSRIQMTSLCTKMIINVDFNTFCIFVVMLIFSFVFLVETPEIKVAD